MSLALPDTSTVRGHWRIARVDHWVKNLFVVPGIVVAVGWHLGDQAVLRGLGWRVVLGLLACGIVASSNYTLNEAIDGPYDLYHPAKRLRPIPTGEVRVTHALAQWMILGAAGIALAFAINRRFVLTMLALWIMGCAYNIPPVRTKDVPFVDVLTEALNNPIRMVAGWYIVADQAARRSRSIADRSPPSPKNACW
jgi:4-hydroxybenzoate polyprenyltransferase